MSSTPHEARSLKRTAFALLLVSIVRYGGELATGHTESDNVSAVVADSLLTWTTAAVADAEARTRPLRPDERIDPNVAGAVQLDRLPGIGPATAAAIVTARDSGVVFSSSADLTRVRGVGPATVARMSDHLTFGAARRGRPRSRGATQPPEARAGVPRSPGPATVDLNTATSEALQTLPGIGPALAGRILEARREQGFSRLEDVTRVPGIGSATVERLRGLAVVRRRR